MADSTGSGDRSRTQRDETQLQQLDRNWSDLLQELRVGQTGVQLLTGFLLILPFQPRFAELTTLQQTTYLVTLGAAVVATAFLIAPVSLHRLLFRRHERRATVQLAHRWAEVGLALLGVAMVGAVLLIGSVVLGTVPAVIGAAVIALTLLVLWVLVPLRVLAGDQDDDGGSSGDDQR